MQQAVESVLPLVAVSNDAKLEPGAVEQYKVHGRDGIDLLHHVAEFNVLRDGAVEIDHFGVLVAPPLEEHILLSLPDHLETVCKGRGIASIGLLMITTHEYLYMHRDKEHTTVVISFLALTPSS